jgi:hypothetical protein
VDVKIAKLSAMKGSEREEFVAQHKVPAVLGPRSRTYIVDHHHLARACWEMGHREMRVDIADDLSKLPYPNFWKKLAERNWIHLYDQFGGGPHDPLALPRTVRGLADDPFRSLAWAVRERGGFEKTEAPFSEFRWAEFFRKKLTVHPVFDGREPAIAEALALAKSPAAPGLPGHTT